MSDEPIDDQHDEPERTTLDIEGDAAADYIEELLDIADLDGDIDIEVRDGRAYVSVHSDDEEANLGVLARQPVVVALQELTRLAVQRRTGEYSRLVLDVQGSREQREQELRDLVADAAERLQAGDARVALAPMSSYERKLVHDFAREAGLGSDSEGEGHGRHVVLSHGNAPADADAEAGEPEEAR
jgi:spoIIIJ-associated protein